MILYPHSSLAVPKVCVFQCISCNKAMSYLSSLILANMSCLFSLLANSLQFNDINLISVPVTHIELDLGLSLIYNVVEQFLL